MIAFQWIQLFYWATHKYRKGKYTLLLCDGYRSHLTFKFVDFCEKNSIIIFFLPPYTSHILQPLDVGVFHAYKHWHSEAVADATYSDSDKFTKVKFLHALSSIHTKTLKRSTIKHGFWDTIPVSFKSGVVLDILSNTYSITSPLSRSKYSFFSLGSTSKTEVWFKEVGLKISHIHDTDVSCFQENLDLLVKGGIAMMYYMEALHTELEHYTKASAKRLEWSRASKCQVQKEGIVLNMNLASMQWYEISFDILKDQLIKWDGGQNGRLSWWNLLTSSYNVELLLGGRD